MKHFNTQEERLDFLTQTLRDDSRNYKDLSLPKNTREKRDLMRSFMNIRMPDPISEEFLEIQNSFLQEEAREKGITEIAQIPSIAEEFGLKEAISLRMALWQGDITTLAADAIVNAANSQMLGCFIPCHSCIDNAIHSAAGIQLREACNQLMKAQGCEEPTGQARITKGYNLPCRYVIHTVGPIIRGPLTERDCSLLASCYRQCLALAAAQGLSSIAFCCISTGEFHFPPEKAAEIAIAEVGAFLAENETIEKVIFNVYKDEDLEIYRRNFI